MTTPCKAYSGFIGNSYILNELFPGFIGNSNINELFPGFIGNSNINELFPGFIGNSNINELFPGFIGNSNINELYPNQIFYQFLRDVPFSANHTLLPNIAYMNICVREIYSFVNQTLLLDLYQM